MAIVIVNFPAGSPLIAAFTRLGHTVQTPDDALRAGTLSSACVAVSDFRGMAKDFKAAIRLGWRISRAGVPHVYWNREGPSHFGEKRWRLWLLRRFGRIDVYAAHTLQNCKGFARDVLYLPNAADADRYNLHGATLADLRDPSRYRHDVSFFGNTDEDRYPEVAPRARFLAALAPRLERHGIRLSVHRGALSLDEQIALIQSSRINLSIHSGADSRYREHARHKARGWGLPERCYGVPAAGGFLLSDSRFHAADDFLPETEWASFTDVESCVAGIRHFLTHFDEARRIAEAAHRRVLAQHTYLHRAARLIELAALCRPASSQPGHAR
jgi:spore maturation protein CgeB